tara:strand:- start:8228 stop:11104 length:2877 start_codon:yes stop_codon:yes gene_type:complete
MNEYADIQVIECNRLHSEEAKSRNNQNYALWTNNLQDIVHLEPGDKVSVFGAMISERGAGQSSSIEIKGVDLGFTKDYTTINISGVNASSEIPGGYEELQAVLNTETKTIRDDIGYFKMSYYINMDGHNYIQLPRRWWFKPTRTTNNYGNFDDRHTYGMSLSDPFATDDYVLYDDFYQLSAPPGYGESGIGISGYLSKVRNDNSRFTIMVRDNTYYSESSADGNLPPFQLRDPENCVYFIYEELKELSIEKGFNSPEYISEELTRQLQEVKTQQVYEKRSSTDLTDNPDRPGFPVPVYGTYSTETYKPFNCAGLYAVQTNVLSDTPEQYFDFYIKGSQTNNASGWEYLQNYHIVGCKRPELYTTGRLINRENSAYAGIEGSLLDDDYDGTYNASQETNGMILRIDYTETMLNLFRDFILAQEKYPEVWNIFSDSRTPYDDGDNINNSRWFHMNRFPNIDMQGTYLLSQLGWGGYTLPTGGNASSNYNSVIVPFQYDPAQKDKFYNRPVEELNEKTYGCFGRSKEGQIVVYPTENNGSGSTLFNMLNNASNIIEEQRACGYDMHFTAPGNAWCLPYSGFTQTPIDYDSRGADITDYRISRNSQNQVLNNYKVDTSDQRRQLYLGADEPEVKWDGTHFSFSQLHTALYRSQTNFADNPFTDGAVDTDTQANQQVFKIHPKENYNDWTPARMPYVADVNVTINKTGQDHVYTTHKFNSNLEPWTIYDAQCGVAIEDFGLTENEWTGTLWDLLGFSYTQFHSSTNTRLQRIDNSNVNSLSVITTNAKIPGDKSQGYSQNLWEAPLYNNMMPLVASLLDKNGTFEVVHFPEIIVEANSMDIVADNLPTRMIRGYYTIRSNILQDAPFIGGKVNNTQMPIIGIVNKINGTGDFYTQEESSLDFTITKPLRLASLTCSVHDPDGSYANTSEQNTILFKIQKNRNVSFNVVEEIIQENKGKVPAFL